MHDYKLIGPFSEVVTFGDIPLKGAINDDHLELITNGGILIRDDTIAEVNRYDQLKSKAKSLNAQIYAIDSPMVALPGFIDAHTHICFAGGRSEDYALRNSGASYLEIAAAGGGIWDTVTHTRQASIESLSRGIEKRAEMHLQRGVTTIEVKSGYGLSVHEELKMLKAIQIADKSCKADLIPTCLAAHIIPKEYDGNAISYLEEIVHELFPLIKNQKLTNRIDAFIEDGAFDASNIAHYLTRGRQMNFDITIHADQFHPGGSKVAVQYGAISADHLEASTDEEIHMLAKSNTIATALPGASIGLGCPFTPARKLLDAGCCLVIASDWNPGSAPIGNLMTVASILGTFEKLSNAEVLSGLTFRAAAALGLTDRGKIMSGMKADILAFPTYTYQDITYHQGQLAPGLIWKNGQLNTDD